MRLRLVILTAVLTISSFAQTVQPAQKPATKPAAKPAQKPATTTTTSAQTAASKQTAEAPVIMLKGACLDAQGKEVVRTLDQTGCHNAVTRAQFEKLTHALFPELNPTLRRSFATTLARMLAYSNEAQRKGLDRSADYQDLLQFARLQVLAQLAARQTQESALKITPAEIQKYYNDNKANFEEYTLQRVIVPKRPASKEQPVDEAAEKAFAEKIRQRWEAGEDPDKLQKEAFERASNKSAPPPVDLGMRRKGTLSPAQSAVYDLKPGQISQIFPDPSGFFIFKVLRRDTAALEKYEDEIRRTLRGQRLQAENERLMKQTTVELNESYFGSEDLKGGEMRAPLRPAQPGQQPPKPGIEAPKPPTQQPQQAVPQKQ